MIKAWPARRNDPLWFIALLATVPFAAHAQVYKCPQANGTTAFQSTPCTGNDKTPARPSVAQLNAQRAAAPKDDKAYDDPYANDVGSRPRAQAPAFQPGNDDSAAQKTSGLVADVQARNRRENEQQAYRDAHKNDKRVDMAACNSARHNLGVLSEQRPVFSYDNKGNRVFVEDKDRASRIAEAQRWVAAVCP